MLNHATDRSPPVKPSPPNENSPQRLAGHASEIPQMRRSQRVSCNLFAMIETFDGLCLVAPAVPFDKVGVRGSFDNSGVRGSFDNSEGKYGVRHSDDKAIAKQVFDTRVSLRVAPAQAWMPPLLA
jgi:hypothetical protein